MKVKLISYYSIFIGVSVIAMWTVIVLKDPPTEGKTEMSFHLLSEFLMASICLISGFMLRGKRKKGKVLNISGLGMVIYSVLNAAGHYGEKNESEMMFFFIILFLLTSITLFLHFESGRQVSGKS